MAHGLETIVEAAERCRDVERIRFLIMGDGAKRRDLERDARARGLDNLIFKDPVPHDQIPSYLDAMDLAVVHLRADPVFRTAIPSKTFEFMAMGVPILMGVEGETAEIVESTGCGVCVPSGDADAMAREVRRLSRDRDALQTMARLGKVAAAERYSRTVQAGLELESLEAAIRRYRD